MFIIDKLIESYVCDRIRNSFTCENEHFIRENRQPKGTSKRIMQ